MNTIDVIFQLAFILAINVLIQAIFLIELHIKYKMLMYIIQLGKSVK